MSVGSHSITAVYAGNASFLASTSTALVQTVTQSVTTTAVTTTSMSSSANPSVSGQPVTWTATVAAASPGSGTPTGTVQFRVDGSNFGGPAALSGGSSTSGANAALSVGSHSITAVYSGDGSFLASTAAALTQTVNKANTVATITNSPSNATVTGESLAITFPVTAAAPGAGTPTGNVIVSAGADSCAGTVVGGTCTLTFTSAGAKSIVAAYVGDSEFNDIVSGAFSHNVGQSATTITTLTSSAATAVFG